MLAASSVEVRINGHAILPRTSVTAGLREVVAVKGPSGSGKTTLMACLGGLFRPTSGTVAIHGHELTRMSARQRAAFRLKEIGFVYQHADLLPELTPVQNVMLPALLAGTDVDEARAKAERLIGDLAVCTTAGTATVSGGEAQRLALARALITAPSLLLADEPTGSLDDRTRDEVLELMLSQIRQHNMGAVIATHDRVVAARADRTVQLPDLPVEGRTA